MKKKKINKTVYYLFNIIMTIISIILIVTVNNIDILPTKYFMLFVILDILILLTILLLRNRKSKKVRIFGTIVGVLFVLISLFGINYGQDTINFLKSAFNNQVTEVTTYKIISLNDSGINNILDLKNKNIGYLNTIDKKAIDKINFKYNPVVDEDLYALYDKLLDKKIDALYIEDVYINILSDDFNISNLMSIHEFEIVTKKAMEEELKNLKTVNIYLSGSDSRSKTLHSKSRSDVNMLLTINPLKHKILMTSIPRDYYVYVYGQTGLKDKLTHSGIYGLDVSSKTVGNLFDVNIDYNIKVGFASVVKLVDLVGGIDIESDRTFTTSCGDAGAIITKVKKGMNHFTGAQALSYARERYAYKDGDNHRIKNQQQVLEAVFKKLLEDKVTLSEYEVLLNTLKSLYITNIPKSFITLIVKDQLNSSTKWEFIRQTVSGVGASKQTHTSPSLKRYVMIPYPEDVKRASEKIKETMK